MKLPTLIALGVICGLVSSGCTQVKPEREAGSVTGIPAPANSGADPVTARMDAKWVSAIVGMRVQTPDGTSLGRVRDVVVDGYGVGSFAIVAYGGVMGLGIRYTAVPWVNVAGMLDRDRLLVDRSKLESAPLLLSANPGPGDNGWRHRAESYWNGKVAVAQ
jgi:sporulation protein YlmC with PRC-barrel domain